MGIDLTNPQTQALVSLILSAITAIGGFFYIVSQIRKNRADSGKTEADKESSLSETALALLAPYKTEVEGLRKDLADCKKAMEQKVEEAIADAVAVVDAKYKRQISSLKARIRELENA